MNRIGNLIKYAGLLSLLLTICALPALAQDCQKSCTKTCTQSCDKKADAACTQQCCGTCDKSAKAEQCCGTCDQAACDKKACDKKACEQSCSKSGTCPVTGKTAQTCPKSGSCPVTGKTAQTCPHSGATMSMDDMMAGWDKCEICKTLTENPDLMAGCSYSIGKWSEGLVCNLHVKDMSLMPAFKKHFENDAALTKKFMGMKPEERSNHLCPICDHYLMFLDKGAKEERFMTPTGAITMVRAECPDMVNSLHGWGDMINEMVASFDAMMAEGRMPGAAQTACSAQSPCSATCSASTSCSAKTPCAAKAESPKGADNTAQTMPPEFMEMMKNCRVCRVFCDHPEMMFAAEPSIIYVSQGVLFLGTVHDKSQVKAYQEVSHKLMDQVEQVKQLPPDQAMKEICPYCRMFAGLAAKGANIDTKDTPTGTCTVVTGTTPELIKDIHEMGRTVEKAHKEMSF